MTPEQADDTINRLGDGYAITVITVSENEYQGIFDGTKTDRDFLCWETLSGQLFRAAWSDVQSVSARGARAVMSNRFVVPPEHPLSGVPMKALRPYTTRNP